MEFEYNISILHVEDDTVDAESLERSFRRNKVTNPLYHAENGLQALAMLRDSSVPKPRIVLLDVNMPKMGGLEFLDEIRKDPELQHLTVFMLTTSSQEVDMVRAYRYNVAGYIVKPASSEKLHALVRTLSEFWNLSEFPRPKQPTEG